MKPSVYLLGFRGAGKSTFLELLRERLACEAVDLDLLLEARLGERILDFVDKRGIEAFRQEECTLLREQEERNAREARILATGGGVVDWAASREILANSPHARVFLRTSPELLWERLRDQPERQKILGLHSLASLRELLAVRTPYYTSLATHVLENFDLNNTSQQLEMLCRKLWL